MQEHFDTQCNKTTICSECLKIIRSSDVNTITIKTHNNYKFALSLVATEAFNTRMFYKVLYTL